MLLPLVGHSRLATPDQNLLSHSTRASASPAKASAAPSGAGGETLSITEQVAYQMEQDLDYQILRKTFNLDEARVSAAAIRDTRSREAMSQARGSIDADWDVSLARLERLGVQAADFDLDVSWSRVSSFQAEFSARSQDGRLAMQVQQFEAESLRLDVSLTAPAQVQTGDPLVLDLGGQGVQTTGVEAGVLFDLDADGRLDLTSSVTGDSWLLALDASGNGRIDDGRELFGDQKGAANGFEELARYDSNQDGRIDAADPVYSQLRLLQIKGDGEQVTQSLGEAKVASIELGYQDTRKALGLYDQVAQTGSFVREDGRRGEAADVLLGYTRLA